MRIRHYSFSGLAGCVVQRRVRSTKTLVGVYHAEQAGIDSDPENPWVTVCEEHGSIVTHRTLAMAMSQLPDPSEFCEDCREEEEETVQLNPCESCKDCRENACEFCEDC